MSSFARQTVQQLIAQVKAGFQAVLAGADLALRRSNLTVTATMVGAAVDGQYGYLDWIIDNALMPDTAVAPYSNRWGAFKGVSPKPPVAATGSAQWLGGLPATSISAGTLIQLPNNTGATLNFKTTETITLDGSGNGTATIAAVLPSPTTDGSQWNCDAGAELQMVTAVAGVPGTATVVANIVNGTAPETNEAFVQRYLELYKAPPQGGDKEDYAEWGLEVPAVTRAWCVPLQKGPGTVVVYVMEDVAEAAFSGFPQGTNGVATSEARDSPATGDQLVVANYIYPLRPATALVYVFAPQAAPQNFTIKYVPSSQQSLVETAIETVLFNEGAPDGVTLVDVGDVQDAVRAVPLCSRALIQSPTDEFGTALGYLPTLGTVTWL